MICNHESAYAVWCINPKTKRVIKTDKTTKGLAGWKGWGAVRVIELS